MMPTPCSLTSSLALLVLLGTVRAGPFSPRFNITRPGPRPPPQPGGHTAEPGVGSPSAQLYEHTVEGGEKQVVFTHRINLPPSAGCGCPPGTEPPAPASEVQSLKVRLEILEELVQGLKEQCTGGCCPVTAKAGTGQTDTRSLCSLHGVFDLSRCACSCEPGWGGPTCSDPTDAPVSPSSSPSCPDDCNDQGRCVRGRCECFPGYTGPSCSWPSCPGDCHGRGRCVQGVCVCRPGFSGADCSLRACPRGCSQKGRCEDGRCVCNPGYTGDDCGVKSCPRDCSQRGRCENGRCVCNPGYTGDDCGARSCPRGCSQKGRCEDGRCVCEPGYTGADCGSRSCPWDCGEGGRCVDGRCVCWPGYAGDDCSRRTCPRDCHGRGRCEDGECLCDAGYSGDDCGVRSCPGDCSQRGRCEDGRCVCWPGYTGPDCGAKSCPRDCRGRGRCEAGVCVCHPGYGGDDCGVRSCPGDCRGRGRCESGRCVCWPGYTGRDCGVRACPGDCRGRGRCVDGRCICNPGFAGDDCGSRRCPGDCRGRGRCEDGVCVCDAGYQGEDCGARSCPGGCRGRGQCLDGRCVCDDGYEGEDCGVRRCPRDCSQRGVCQDGVCACWEGYAGEDCGLRTCPSNCHGRGRCEEGRCVCDSGYTGPTCGVRTCPSDCRGHGRCVQGVCVCHPGYSGPDCGQDEPPASACPGGCGPRELCREGRCVCVEGFRGPDCAIQTCPADCLGRGECLEGSCVCQEGYAGEDCSEEIPAIENMRMHLLEETTVRTEWTRGPGTVDAYEIQFIPMFSLLQTEGMSPPFTARVPSSASAYDQRGLAPGQEYQVTVRALRGTSWGPPASKTITTMIDGPQDLRVVAVTPTTLDLSWLRPQAEVDRFVVSYVSAGNQRVRLEVPPEADRALLTDLMPGVEYVVTVTAERGPAVSYPASIRANTAPGHYSYPEVRPPPPSPQPRPGPQPSPPLLPPRPRRPSRPAEEVGPESRLPPSPPQPPRRPWGNLTAELGRFRGSVQDLERHLRARGYPLRANQTYTAVARHIHEYLLRRQAAPPAPPPRRPHPTASPNAGARKRDSSQGSYDRGTVPRHPKPEVLGFSADGTLLVSLDGLRGHFERMVLRWRPELPADGPGGELTVPGTSRTASLPNLKPSTTYHVEVHGVRAGQTSKSYAFVTTTGSSPTGFLGATDEPPPSGPSTTQGAQAPTLQHRPQELGELRVLGRDMTGRLHVTWTAQPDTFAHFQLTLQVPEGSWVHEELLPGDVHEALVPSPPPGVAYELTLHGVLPSGEPSSPLTYHGIKEKPEKPEKPLTLPRLGELTVTDAASSSLTLHWTVSEGEFDSFVIQYKDRDGPQVVPVEGSQREALITNLELNRKYKFVLYGMVGKKKHGPLVAEAKIVPQSDPISETSPRLGKLWVTDPTPDSLHLSWTVPEGQFDSFLVQYRGKDGQPQVIPVEGPERSATVSQLAPDHKYRFTLFGIANRKRHGPLMAEGTTAPEKKPGHPEPLEQPLLGKLTVNGATPDSLVLSWTVDQGSFDSFMVQYKDAQGQPQAVPVRGHENTVTIRGLESNRKYKMNLYGLHGRHRVGPVSVVASTAPQEVMETPTEPPSTEAPEPPEEPLLGKLTVTGSSQDSLSLSWTVPQGHFDRFLVQYKNGDGQPKVVRVPGTQDWVTISGLEPDHKYKVNLYGFHNGQRVGPISATGVTATEEKTPTETEVTPTEPPSTEAPESPEEPLLGELTVTGSSQDSLSLSWTVPQGHFDRFLVQYKNGDGQPKVVRVPGTQDWVTISGLEPDHKYKVNLYGFHNGQRVGPISATGVTATEEKTPTETEVTPTEPPSTEAPESPEEPLLGELTVTGSSQDSLSLSWTVPQGHFDRFLVQYKNGDGQPKVVRVPGTQDWVTISGLEPDHKYKMNLYGFHNGQRVGPISAFGVTDAVEETPTPTEPPSTEAPEPTVEPLLGELTVTGSSQDSLSLSWTVPQGHFDSFTIQYKDRDGQPQVVRVGGEEREVTVQGLDAGRKYKMHLYGLHGGQRVGPASTVGVTEDEPSPVTTPPLEPRLGQLTVTSVTPSSVGLSWTVPEGKFDSFVVQYKGKDGQPQMVPVSKDQLEVTIPGLEPARKYKMNLYGLQSGQRVGPLSVVAMTAPLPTVPATEPPQEPQLGDLTVTDVTPDSVGLLWTVPGGEFDSFVVQYKDKDGQPQVVPMAADQREATIPGLEPNKKYKFLLFGIKDGKRSSPLSVEAKTVASPGTTPRLGELWVTDPTPDSLHLSWTVPEGHFDSFVVQFKDRDGPRLVPVEGQERSVTITPLDANRKYRFLLYGLLGKKRYGPLTADGTTENRGSQDDTGIKRLPKPRLGEELQVTSVTPDSVDLSWTVTEGHFDSFVVQYKDKDGQPQVVPVEGSLREVRVPDLDPGRRYKLLLYGLHQGKRVGPLSTTAVTGHREDIGTTTLTSNTPAPEVFLGELTVVEATPHTLHLSWIETEGEFDSFEVQFIDQTGKQEVLTVGGDQKDITLYDLESDHRYLVNLYGFHGQQRVGPAQVEALTVLREEEDEPSEPPTISSEPPFKPLLGELTVTGSSQDSLSLSWTIPEGHFDSFVIQYKNGDEQPKIVQVPGHQNWVTISGLEPDHKYKVNLYGFYSDQRVGPISAVGVTDAVEETPIPTEPPSTEAPEPPEEPLLGELTVSGSSQDSLSLSWTVPQGHFDSFTIQYKDKDGQPQVVRVRGEEREVTVRGLDAGRKYKMHLYGLHGGQRVGPVSTVGVTASLPTEPPVALSLGELTVVSVASDTVHLSWTVAQGPFDSFLVQYKDSQGQPQAVPVDGSLREVIVSGLDPARKYKFLLFGLQDEKKHGPVSTEAKTLPDKKPSPRLGDLTVTDVTPDSVGLLWTVPEGEFDSFVVQYKDKDRQPQVVPVAADQRKVTIPGLEPKKKYKFLLYGLAGRKRLGPVSAEGTTAPLEKELPPLPRLGELTLTDETPDSIHLSWTVAQGPFDSFVVQYRGTDGQPRAVPVAADEREVTIEGLEAGKKYKFLLFGLFRGQRLGPISGLGATASAEDTPIPGIPATEAPEGPRLGVLTVNSVAPDALRLSWSVAQGVFESFVIQYRDTDGKSQALLVDGDQSTVLVSSLEPSTPYMFSLYGLHGGKRLGPISAEGITGPAPPAGEIPGEPRPRLSQLSVTDVTTSSLRLNWEAPPGAFDSFLLRFGVPSQSSLEPYPRPLLQRELTVPGSRRSAAIRDLRPGTLYNLTLYGLRGPHKADSIQGSARTLSPVLESPHDLQFSEIGETSAKVSWTPPPSRVDSFKVSYQLADGGEPQSVRVDSRAQTQTLKGLAPGTRYEVTVVSIRGFEESEPLTGFFTTVSDGPTKLQALNLTEGSTVLHWDPPQNPVDTYDVQVTAPEAPSLQASAPGSAVDYPLSGLELHTNYTAMVRGLRGSNFTSPANITFTTGLEAPRDLEAKEVTPRTALLTWTEPPDPPTGYLLSFNTPGEQTQEILLPGGVTSHRLLGLFPSTTYNAFLRAVWGESFSPPMPTSFTTGGLRIPFPRDCGEEMQNGISTSRTTTIFLNGNRERPLDVFCDMETDGGGWLVFQRRMDGKTDFWRDWEDYAHGFGNISREFWLGNEALHSLTSSGDYSLRVDLRAGDEAVFAHYDSFRVDSAAKYYQLHLEGYHGTAGDSMTYHSGSVFSARDRDPNNLLISCAVSYRGAWWYRNCHYANLNGLYGSTVDHQGVSWYYWKGFGFSVPFTEMKLRPRNYHPPAWGG
ncbi:tenascin-X isoform X20 [Erinaceus europaeus]|uniref:Tenascin-X isoform X20 n=1 Tax=Erinaceus europaeus TaxID=9365 RepID=A0ABM3X9M0_ERIEU|nr:tenascin-X isoform X20 [Erinaceus europaeus]